MSSPPSSTGEATSGTNKVCASINNMQRRRSQEEQQYATTSSLFALCNFDLRDILHTRGANSGQEQVQLLTEAFSDQPMRRLPALARNGNEDIQGGAEENRSPSPNPSHTQAHILRILQEAARIIDFVEDD
jgi:hypothetical protein